MVAWNAKLPIPTKVKPWLDDQGEKSHNAGDSYHGADGVSSREGLVLDRYYGEEC
jgi:hypothetical protein